MRVMMVMRLALLAAVLLVLIPAVSSGQDQDVPAGFRFVGNYRIEKRVKIREGAPLSVAMKPFVYRAYTDGIEVRLYGDQTTEGFSSFTVYRNDGLISRTGPGTMETVPGVHAKTEDGNILRHLTLTDERLVLTKFPALSDAVEVIYANRFVILTRN